MRLAAAASSLLVILAASVCAAATIHVPRDYPKISQAVAAAIPGDSVAVSPGMYTEQATIEIDISLTLYSTHGAANTVIDGEDARRILRILSGEVLIRGLSFENGRIVPPVYSGAAILMGAGAVVTIEDCVFRDCSAFSSGAVHVSASTGQGTILFARRCRFEDNYADETAGAVYVVLGATAFFEDCVFRGNETQIGAGAVHAHRGSMHFERCVFLKNRSGDIAGGLYYGTASSGSIRNCTFFDHTSPGNIAGTIVAGPGTEITRSLFIGETDGFGVRWYTGEGTHSCNVFWDNADGAMGAGSLGVGEVVADPLICDPGFGALTVSPQSPCLPGNHPDGADCGLIGTFGQGCGPVSVERETWAGIKALYRSSNGGSP